MCWTPGEDVSRLSPSGCFFLVCTGAEGPEGEQPARQAPGIWDPGQRSEMDFGAEPVLGVSASSSSNKELQREVGRLGPDCPTGVLTRAGGRDHPKSQTRVLLGRAKLLISQHPLGRSGLGGGTPCWALRPETCPFLPRELSMAPKCIITGYVFP